jgi:transcriptional regulator with XRE-family HTH domain
MEAQTPGQIIGANIRTVRTAGMFTRHELAERAGLSVQGIIRIEQGRSARPRRATIEKIAEALGVPVERLLEGTESDGDGGDGRRPEGVKITTAHLEAAREEHDRLNAALEAGEITQAFYSRRVADLYAATAEEVAQELRGKAG